MHQPGNRTMRLLFVLSPDQLRVCATVGKRRGAVSKRGQRFHIRSGQPRIGWLEPSQPVPMFGSHLELAGFGGALGENLDRAYPGGGKGGALRVGPPLEFRSVAEMKAVEKRAGVEGGRRLPCFCGDRGAEISDVAGYSRGIESKRRRREDHVVAQIATEVVERLREPVTRAILVHLGPEHGHYALAGNPCRVGGGQDREQCQRAGALCRLGTGCRPVDPQAAESPEPQCFEAC
jgi:hypothetical protein